MQCDPSVTVEDCAIAEIAEATDAEVGRAFQRPDIETYLRVDDDLPDGGCVDVGLEERPSDGGEEYAALQLIVERATEEMADAKQARATA